MGMTGHWPNFEAVESALQAAMPALADETAALIRTVAPVGKDPERPGGALRDSLKGEANGLTLRVTSDEEHARYVQEGTQPHEIQATQAGVLRFWVQGSGLMFRRVVHHPGTQPNDYPGAVADAIDANVRTTIDRVLQEALAS